MLDIFKQYATDEVLENNGTWKEIGGGAKLLVARTNNKAYGKLLTKLIEQSKDVLNSEGPAADAESERVMIAVLANTVLLGWQGIAYKGQPLPYTPDNAAELLKLKDFRRVVQNIADDINNYLLKEEVAQGEA